METRGRTEDLQTEGETINTLRDDEGSGNSWSEQDVMRRGKQNLAHWTQDERMNRKHWDLRHTAGDSNGDKQAGRQTMRHKESNSMSTHTQSLDIRIIFITQTAYLIQHVN